MVGTRPVASGLVPVGPVCASAPLLLPLPGRESPGDRQHGDDHREEDHPGEHVAVPPARLRLAARQRQAGHQRRGDEKRGDPDTAEHEEQGGEGIGEVTARATGRRAACRGGERDDGEQGQHGKDGAAGANRVESGVPGGRGHGPY